MAQGNLLLFGRFLKIHKMPHSQKTVSHQKMIQLQKSEIQDARTSPPFKAQKSVFLDLPCRKSLNPQQAPIWHQWDPVTTFLVYKKR